MRQIKIKTPGKNWIRCNYTKNFFELLDGMFKDSTKPLLMEFHFLLRPAIITTESRGTRHLPILDILTFDKNFKLIRKLENIKNEKLTLMKFNEKYILEIPHAKRFKKLSEIKKLKIKLY